MVTLDSAALLIKNQLVDTGSWVLLLDLASPDGLTTIHICSNTVDVVKDGITYIAFPFDLDNITENAKGELPTLSLKVSNVNRLVQSYIEQDETLGSNWDVTLQVVHSSGRQNYITYSQDLLEDTWISTGTLVVGGSDLNFLDPFGKLNAFDLFGADGVLTPTLETTIDNLEYSPNASVYVKQYSEGTGFTLGMYSETSGLPVFKEEFLFTAGVPSQVVTLDGSGVTTIEAVDHNWFRIAMQPSSWTSGDSLRYVIQPTDGVISGTAIKATCIQIADSKIPYTPTDATSIPEGILSNPELTVSFKSLSVTADHEWVTFQLGMANPLRKAIPRVKYLAASCQHTYKKHGCPYAGALPTCLKTLADCDAHFPTDSVLPFLGFPAIASVAIYAK